ncbi:unnamed protein product [Paramecium octaurelia]|uniref:Uncharacterized protein n=1 Tax=Paramecium octaurelia TaxID=43137 RepID=A0A8S1YR02_PAROT|nr:unnamed protein product [Paramecium octaurelia]
MYCNLNHSFRLCCVGNYCTLERGKRSIACVAQIKQLLFLPNCLSLMQLIMFAMYLSPYKLMNITIILVINRELKILQMILIINLTQCQILIISNLQLCFISQELDFQKVNLDNFGYIKLNSLSHSQQEYFT